MFQHYVETDPDVTYFDIVRQSASHEELCKIMVFDLIANNADRKGGHCLVGTDDRIWSIDHGLTFHPSFKLRTVMMEFWGREVPTELVADLGRLHRKVSTGSDDTAEIRKTLSGPELKALIKRLRFMLSNPVIPKLDPNYNIPYPFV